MRAALLATLLCACGETHTWTLPLRIAPEQDPIADADSIEVRVASAAGVAIHEFGVDENPLVLPLADPDARIDRVEVSALAGPDRWAYGRAGPFVPRDVPEPPPIYFGIVRQFARTAMPPPPGGGFAAATSWGAWVATGTGLARYVHATGRFEEGLALEGSEDARWVALDGGRMAAFVGRSVHLFDEDGEVVLEAGGLPSDTSGATIVGIPRGRVLVVGPESIWIWPGEDDPDAAVPVWDLVPPRTGASATLLGGVEDATGFVLVAGGWDDASDEPVGEIIVVDLEIPGAELQTTPLGTPRSEHAAMEVRQLRGNVWLLGGRTSDGFTDAVEDVIVFATGELSTVNRSVALFRPRAGAAVIGLPGGDILVAGGETFPDSDSHIAERFQFQQGGNAVQTGSLPTGIPRPKAVTLRDGSVLVAGDEAAAVYVPDPG